MRRQFFPALGMLVAFTVLTGVLYPLVVTAFAQIGFPETANGSLIERDGAPVGSTLIGQPFNQPGYFHPRPSAAGDGYDATRSSGTNLGPTNDTWLATVAQRAAAYREENLLSPSTLVPADAVTASASGLDPHISVANARLQAKRVAQARGLPVDVVTDMIDANTQQRRFVVLGEPGVNVLLLNIALDSASRLNEPEQDVDP